MPLFLFIIDLDVTHLNYVLTKSYIYGIMYSQRTKGVNKMKEKIKSFFHIEHAYSFEWNDLRAVLSLINFILLLFSFPLGAGFGLIIAILGLIKDFTTDRHINGIAMHLVSVMLNSYILFFC